MATSIQGYEDREPDAAERLGRVVASLRGTECSVCRVPVTGLDALYSVAMGLSERARCLTCLAAGLNQSSNELRDHLTRHFQVRDCYREIWIRETEGTSLGRAPELAEGGDLRKLSAARAVPEQTEGCPPDGTRTDIAADAYWDAGDLGCGELILMLRRRIVELPSRAVLRLVARDPGAVEDIPAWCRLTGHRLLVQMNPEFIIQRKD